jgi:WD40 repeat protein
MPKMEKSSPNPQEQVRPYSLSQITHQRHCLRQRRQDLCDCIVVLPSIRNDRLCILWKYNPDSEKKIEPVLKLTQNDAILTLSFNPLTYELFSGGAADFALFIPGKKEIPKEKFKEKIISSGWSADGQTLAFGSINGTLSFRHRNLD